MGRRPIFMNKLVKRIQHSGKVLLLGAAIVASDALLSAPNANAVVAGRTTVAGPRGAYSRTTVAGRGGYYSRGTAVSGGNAVRGGAVAGRAAGIRPLPAGARAVYVGGVRYYNAGGVYYRPVVQGGQTTYVVTNVR